VRVWRECGSLRVCERGRGIEKEKAKERGCASHTCALA